MTQIALPLTADRREPARIVVGSANAAVLDACRDALNWPFRTAVLAGEPRCGKSLIAQWFAAEGLGEAIDDAQLLDETELFHRWNRAQQSGVPLLLINGSGQQGWTIQLPDLASRMGAAAMLRIGPLDDAMMADLIAFHAQQRGAPIGPDAAAYLVPRTTRSHLAIEQLVGIIDRLSLERKVPPTQGVWRDALDELLGPQQPDLL